MDASNVSALELAKYYLARPLQIFMSVQDARQFQCLINIGTRRLDIAQMTSQALSNVRGEDFCWQMARAMIDLCSVPEPKTGLGLFKKFMDWANQSPKNSLAFVRNILLSIELGGRPIANADEYELRVAMNATGFHGASTNLAEVRPPEQFMLNLYQLAQGGNNQAVETLRYLQRCLNWRWYNLLPIGSDREGLPGFDKIWWSMPGEIDEIYWATVDNAWEAEAASSVESRSCYDRIAPLINEKQELMEDLIAKLWQEICDQPRRDIRPQGLDWFVVREPDGRKNRRYLVREGYSFPSCGIGYQHVGLDGPVYRLVEFGLHKMAEFIKLDQTIEQAGFQRYMAVAFLVNTIALHRIVCQPPRSGGAKGVTEPKSVISGDLAQVIVRDHFRRLHDPAWTASPRQIELALERLGHLPEGYTFVASYDYEKSAAAPKVDQPDEQDIHPLMRIDVTSLLENL